MEAREAREARETVVAKESGQHVTVVQSTEALKQGLVPEDVRTQGHGRVQIVVYVTISVVESRGHSSPRPSTLAVSKSLVK